MSRYRARADHVAAASEARAEPGRWVRACVYPTSTSARDTARDVRTAERLPAYAPAGSFQASVSTEPDGYVLWVVYVADGSQHRHGRALAPDPDTERVLGQIRRGEVVAGPEGARRIAARHEAAYGDVWAPRPPTLTPATPSDDMAWADALADLTTGDPKDGA